MKKAMANPSFLEPKFFTVIVNGFPYNYIETLEPSKTHKGFDVIVERIYSDKVIYNEAKELLKNTN